MKKEKIDGTTVYSGLYTDESGHTWNILIREGGTISLYATGPDIPGHGVAFDTYNRQPPSDFARGIISRLSEMAEGINALIAAVPSIAPGPGQGRRIMPKRIQRLRIKNWRKPEGARIVDRTSIFGNPFPVKVYGLKLAKENFVNWLDGKMIQEPDGTIHMRPDLEARRQRILTRLPELKGKDLVCPCPVEAEWCHAIELMRRAGQE